MFNVAVRDRFFLTLKFYKISRPFVCTKEMQYVEQQNVSRLCCSYSFNKKGESHKNKQRGYLNKKKKCFIYLFKRQNYPERGKRQESSLCWCSSQMTSTGIAQPCQSQAPGTHPESLTWVQVLRPWDQHSLLSSEHWQGARSEVQQPGFKPEPPLDVGSSFTCYATKLGTRRASLISHHTHQVPTCLRNITLHTGLGNNWRPTFCRLPSPRGPSEALCALTVEWIVVPGFGAGSAHYLPQTFLWPLGSELLTSNFVASASFPGCAWVLFSFT